MKVLITGGKGLLAFALEKLLPPSTEAVLWDLEDFDLTQPRQMKDGLDQVRPDWVINTAAYNLVDRCEQERQLSWAVNAQGPETLGSLCAARGIRLVHFSSDYVFDGTQRHPYTEEDAPNPLNHYGAGKLHGERAVLAASPDNLVIRTSWLFGSHPVQSKSYVHSVLRQAGTSQVLRATTDQVAAPTYAPDLARSVWGLVNKHVGGLFHCVNGEGLSRYEWTLAILEEARVAGLVSQIPVVEPVPTSFFGSSMCRPVYTVLGTRKIQDALQAEFPNWRQGVRVMLSDLRLA